MGFGDYPMLPNISTDMKSDWQDYDDPYLKRNFGEPVTFLKFYYALEKIELNGLL